MTATDETRSIHADRESMAAACAGRLVEHLRRDIDAHGQAHVALTGGGAGIAVVAALAEDPGARSLDWSRVHVWWGDERWLPAGDAERNDHQARQAGLDALSTLEPEAGGRPLAEATVHPFPAADEGLSLEEAAETMVRRLTPTPRFTVVLLGLGPDSHVASLFPHHPGLQAAGVPAIAVEGSPKPPPRRLSLSLETINAADEVWFTVAGADKADAVAAVSALHAQGRWDPEHPGSAVRGTRATRWWLDEAAAEPARG